MRCPWLYNQNVLKVLLVAREKKKSGFITCEDMTRDITRFLCLLSWISAIQIFIKPKNTNIEHNTVPQSLLKSDNRYHHHHHHHHRYCYCCCIIAIFHIVCPGHCAKMTAKLTDMKQSWFIIIRKMTKNLKNANTKRKSQEQWYEQKSSLSNVYAQVPSSM